MWYPRFRILSRDRWCWGPLMEKSKWEAVRATGWLTFSHWKACSLSASDARLFQESGLLRDQLQSLGSLLTLEEKKTHLNRGLRDNRDCLKRLLPLWIFFVFFLKYLFIRLFMAVLGLRFCARAFSSCGKQGPLFIAVRGPLTIVASLVAEHRLQTRRLSNCGSRAQLLHGMWDLPRPGLEPVSPALAGRFSTTAPPGKPWIFF